MLSFTAFACSSPATVQQHTGTPAKQLHGCYSSSPLQQSHVRQKCTTELKDYNSLHYRHQSIALHCEQPRV